MSNNKDLRKAKHEAYEEKQERKGAAVVKWIFGVLLVLAVLYMIWTVTQV